jgi:MinD superfamily P-loop ATPase
MQDIKLILKDIEVRKANDFWILKKQNELEQRWYILLIKEWRKGLKKKAGNCAEINFYLIDMSKQNRFQSCFG